MKSRATTIKLFLIAGDANGLRTAEISNWSGKAIAGPRSEIRSFLDRDEIASPGIYLLTGIDPETDMPSLYIGEAENVRKRIKQHQSKDDWTQVITFISKDENLTKAHIRYMEGELIKQVNLLSNVHVRNEASSGARLPESDQADMDMYLENVFALLPVLGVDLLVRPTITRDDPGLLVCDIKGLKATGKRTSSGFVILAGSQAVKQHRTSAKQIAPRRDLLLSQGVLADHGDHLVFTADHELSSPSLAASIVQGGNTNGLLAWKNSQGKSLKDMEAI